MTMAGGSGVSPVFILDDRLLGPSGGPRAHYLGATLSSLNQDLGGSLTLRFGPPTEALAALAHELSARHIVATGEFGPYGNGRDQYVKKELAKLGVELTTLDSPYLVPPGSVRNSKGDPYRVFGAFQRGWHDQLDLQAPAPLNSPRWVPAPSVDLDEVTRRSSSCSPWYFNGVVDLELPLLPPVGEAAAHESLANFARRVATYDDTRNRPDLDRTSRLSAFLKFGVLHPRQVLLTVGETGSNLGTFTSELAWREFYADVLWHRPESAHFELQPVMRELAIDRDEKAQQRFVAWARGETGYPLVDAGMRQLLTEGFMHNRVRMVAASFLVKHLHLDWRWGARWFMWRLFDGDLASNQHGWQWTAGTGTDPSPFHRIFNPTLQAEKFDPSGEYVRRYVTELRDVAAPRCLQPGASDGILSPANYVPPLVNTAEERVEALRRLAAARVSK